MSIITFGQWDGKNNIISLWDVNAVMDGFNYKCFTATIKISIPKKDYNLIPLGENHYNEKIKIVSITKEEYLSNLFNKNKPKTKAKAILLRNGYKI